MEKFFGWYLSLRTSSRIALNAASSWVSTVINAVIGILLVPFLLRELGKEGYGLIVLAAVLVSFTDLVDLGLRGALRRYLAEQVAKNNRQGFNELVSSGMVFYLTAGAVLAGICILSAPWLVSVANVSQDLSPKAIFLIRWYTSTCLILAFLRPVFNAPITCNNRFDVVNAIDSVTAIVRGVGIFALISLIGSPFYSWAIANLVAEILQFSTICYFAYRIWPSLEIRWRHVRKDALRRLFALGGYMYVFQITNLLSVRADPIILTSVLGPAAVALYNPAITLVNRVRPLVNVLVDQLDPVATQYYVSGKSRELQEVLLRGTRYRLLMGVGWSVFFGVFSQSIMKIWLGESLGADYHIAAWLLSIWAVIELTNYAEGTQWPVLLGMKKMRFLVSVTAVCAVINVSASILIVSKTSLGVFGVVIPTIIIGFIYRPIIVAYCARITGMTLKRYFLESYARPMLVFLVLSVLAGVSMFIYIPSTFFSLAIFGMWLGLCWVFLCWFVGFSHGDREAFRVIIAKVFSRSTLCPKKNNIST